MSSYSIGRGELTVDFGLFNGLLCWFMTCQELGSVRWECSPLTEKGFSMIMDHFDLRSTKLTFEQVRLMSPAELALERELIRLANPALARHNPVSQQPGNNIEARLVA